MLAHCGSTPQGEAHLELLGPFVAEGLLLFGEQTASAAVIFASNAGFELLCSTLAIQPWAGIDSGLMQTRLLNNLHHTNTLEVHAHDLLAAFMQYFSRLLAGHLLFA